MAKILVVEDDVKISKLVCDYLTFEHHTVEAVYDGVSGQDRMQVCEYDLIVLDINLPGLDGVTLCKEYRDAGGVAGVLMLTGRQKLSEKEAGLDAGADDYLTKPFHVRELSARIKALLRRTSRGIATSNTLKIGNIILEPSNFRVTRDGKPVKLVPKEFALLEFLMRNPNKVFSADALLSRVWTADEETSSDIIRTHIKNLRKKLDVEGHDSIIQTVHGVGYKVEQPTI